MTIATCLPQEFKIVSGTKGPVTTNGGVTCDYVSLKNCIRCTVVVSLTQAVGHATAITLNKATAVAPTGSTAITGVVPIWVNEAESTTSDTLTKETTDAVAFTVNASISKKTVVFQVDPESLGETFDVLTCILADSSQATNFVSVMYYLQMAYAQETPPSAIVD